MQQLLLLLVVEVAGLRTATGMAGKFTMKIFTRAMKFRVIQMMKMRMKMQSE